MDDYQLPLSKKALTTQIVVSGALIVIACVLTSLFFGRVFPESPAASSIVTIVWVALPLLWGAGSLIALKTWPRTTYVFTNDAFQVRRNGWFGTYSEELYRYETILTVTSRRGLSREYGSLKITLLHLDPVVISGVAGAEQQARKLKEMVAKGQPRVQTFPQ